MFPWNDDQKSQVSQKNKKRQNGSLRRAGSSIMDNTQMTAAGVKKAPQVKDVVSMNQLFDLGHKMDQKSTLQTSDINGGVKKNRFGAVMNLDERLLNQVAGGQNKGQVKPSQMSNRNSSSIVFAHEDKQMKATPSKKQILASVDGNLQNAAQNIEELTDEELEHQAKMLEKRRKALEEMIANEKAQDTASQATRSRVAPSLKENMVPEQQVKMAPSARPPRPGKKGKDASIIQNQNDMANVGYVRAGPTPDDLTKLYFKGGDQAQVLNRGSRSKNAANSQTRIFGADALIPTATVEDLNDKPGKKQFAVQRANSMRNLVNGYSDGETQTAMQKAEQDKAQQHQVGLNRVFKELQQRSNPIF